MTDQKKVFIVVPTLNYKWMEKFIPSLLAYTNYPFKCLIINDKATEESEKYLQNWCNERPDRLSLICNKEQKGVAANWNTGLLYGLQEGADYIVILNDDVLFPQSIIGSREGVIEKPCWLTKMIEYMENDKSIGILSPAWFGANLKYEDYLTQVDNYCIVHKNETEEGMLGCFFMIRAGILMKEMERKEREAGHEPCPGCFDEVNFKVANWEDVDWSKRVRNLGYKTLITHSIALYHFGGKTVYSDYTKDFPGFSEQNRVRFFKKWGININVPWTVSNSRLIWNGKEIESNYKNV